MPHQRTARFLTNVLNPFFVFTALYVLLAFSEASASRAALYIALEIAGAVLVAGYVFLLRRYGRVADFWLSTRRQRLAPALLLLPVFAGLLGALALLNAPEDLFLTTLSMGLASGAVAAVTLFWKMSAHSAVVGHAAAAGLLLLGPGGLLFTLLLPPVLWARVALKAHTVPQTLAGAGVGALFALGFLS